jgi:hypothetical protein
MAQPSSSHHGDRHRSERERAHHHHRSISSTTLLLVLSLVLAVLAVMLSLPSQSSTPTSESSSGGLLGYLTPKRSVAIIARESSVAMREADVARREAELLAGAPGGVIASQSPIICPISTVTETMHAPTQTIIKEVVKEESLAPPNWVGNRAEELLDRELKITEREREVSKREEAINRREHDASLRENWIMEQLMWVSCETCFPRVRSLTHGSVPWATIMHTRLKRRSFMNPRARSENSRYRRLSRAAPSSETKEGPYTTVLLPFLYCPYAPSRSLLLRPGLGDYGVFILSPMSM